MEVARFGDRKRPVVSYAYMIPLSVAKENEEVSRGKKLSYKANPQTSTQKQTNKLTT